MIRCLTTSDGYEVSQKICADMPPAQKLIAGADKFVRSFNRREMTSYDPHQKKKKDRKINVAQRPRKTPGMPCVRN